MRLGTALRSGLQACGRTAPWARRHTITFRDAASGVVQVNLGPETVYAAWRQA